MGTTRNAVPGENVKELSWSDEEVCKYYLCGFCPSELFINTKAEATVGESLVLERKDPLLKPHELTAVPLPFPCGLPLPLARYPSRHCYSSEWHAIVFSLRLMF